MPILLGLVVAHQWGLEQLAPFTVANAAVAVASIVADWGATRALPRNLAALPAEVAAEMLASANALRLLLVAAMAAVGALGMLTHRVAADVAGYGAILFPLCIWTIVATNSVSERIVAAETRGILRAVIAGLTTFAAGAAAVILAGAGPRWFAAAYVVGKAVESGFLVSGRWWVLAVSRSSMLPTGRALWPFSMQMILGVIYARLSVFTVEHMASRVELGVFSVATALYGALLLIPSSMALVQFPELTRRAQRDDRTAVRRLLKRYAILSTTGVLLGVLAFLGLSPLIVRIFKVPQSLAPFVTAFAAIAVASIYSTMAGFLLQAMGREQTTARLSVVTLLLALIYQVTALRWMGLWGIIPAVAAAELSTVALFGVALLRPPSLRRT